MTPSGSNYGISIFTKELVGPLFCLIFTSYQQSFIREINERTPKTKNSKVRYCALKLPLYLLMAPRVVVCLNKLQTNNIAKIVVT